MYMYIQYVYINNMIINELKNNSKEKITKT